MCPTFCNLMDCSPPGSSLRGILQAEILEWVAVSSFGGSSRSRDQTCLSCLLHWQVGSVPLAPPRSPESGLLSTKLCPWLRMSPEILISWYFQPMRQYGWKTPQAERQWGAIRGLWNALGTPGNMGRALVMPYHVVQEQHYLTDLPFSYQLKNPHSFSLVPEFKRAVFLSGPAHLLRFLPASGIDCCKSPSASVENRSVCKIAMWFLHQRSLPIMS